MERVELLAEKLHVSVVRARPSVTDRCRRHRDEPTHEYDENQSQSHRRRRDNDQETLPRLGDEREGSSVGSDQRNHRYERSMGMASVEHEIRSKDSAASAESHTRNLPCEELSFSL